MTNVNRATFRAIWDSTKSDWDAVAHFSEPFLTQLPDRVLYHLRLLCDEDGGFNVDRLEHSLQTATRAYRDDRDDEYVVCALLHDIGDTLVPYNHPELAAAILRPYVSDTNIWMIEHHGIFQGYYFFQHVGLDPNMREQFRGHPAFEYTAEFCAEYDGPAFDDRYDSLPLEEFKPALEAVLASPKKYLYSGANIG